MSQRDRSLDLRSGERANSDESRPGYLPLREAARWAGVSTKTMQRWFERGLRHYQAGPREKVLVRREDIDSFLLSNHAGRETERAG